MTFRSYPPATVEKVSRIAFFRVQLRSSQLADTAISPATSVNSTATKVSGEHFLVGYRFPVPRKDRYSLNEFYGDSEEMTVFPVKSSTEASEHRKFAATKMAPEEEIEEFFAMAEKYEQKRFAEKYNYDIVKDMPLQGKYEWVRLI
ncbi:cyclin-dependent kinase inhibitor 7-like [Neltuma alba]|uniref:cyclin-dependent kinase inhibitor 7-like n=1 Tax=Neltuma alba TaxID=207710 RepID=UPI0010A2FDDD|nr:cyclin-dependent kinase inhibitor 7-like [Prosopis alba]